MPKSLSLSSWIDEVGVRQVAALLAVTEATVYHWRRGYVNPGDYHKFQIKKFSRGAVSYEEMVDTFIRGTSKKKTPIAMRAAKSRL